MEAKGEWSVEEVLTFSSREALHAWLEEHCQTSGGVWLLFGKLGGPRTVKAAEALEEALCFGWIDGQMQSLDSVSYRKYFAPRREKSKWSEKNKALAEKLEREGRMTCFGRKKMEEAKKNGQWDAPTAPAVTEEEIAALARLLEPFEPAHENFMKMSPSVKKTYTRGYQAAKTEAGRKNRLAWMVGRLNQNMKPM